MPSSSVFNGHFCVERMMVPTEAGDAKDGRRDFRLNPLTTAVVLLFDERFVGLR
jgi:hypothetical protein